MNVLYTVQTSLVITYHQNQSDDDDDKYNFVFVSKGCICNDYNLYYTTSTIAKFCIKIKW